MLEPQVVVNPLPELAIGVDLVRHGDVKVFLAFTLSFGKISRAWQKSLRTTARTRFRRSYSVTVVELIAMKTGKIWITVKGESPDFGLPKINQPGKADLKRTST